MIIDNTNYEIGNKAMASVLLLYFHLVDEGGFSHNQTVYVDPDHFDGFEFLGVEVNELPHESLDLNEQLLREGAIIYLLSILNDIVGEYDSDFHLQPCTRRIVGALKSHQNSPIPEVSALLKLISAQGSGFDYTFDYTEFNNTLQFIYRIYVRGFFVKLVT